MQNIFHTGYTYQQIIRLLHAFNVHRNPLGIYWGSIGDASSNENTHELNISKGIYKYRNGIHGMDAEISMFYKNTHEPNISKGIYRYRNGIHGMDTDRHQKYPCFTDIPMNLI